MRHVTKQVMLEFATLWYIKKISEVNTCATCLSMEHCREKGDEKGGFLVAFMKATPTQWLLGGWRIHFHLTLSKKK